VVEKEDQVIDAIAFNVDLTHWPNYRCNEVHIAYRMDINEFRGKRSVQLIVEHLELA
jgi:single-stranded-DNA-specific exonuclease